MPYPWSKPPTACSHRPRKNYPHRRQRKPAFAAVCAPRPVPASLLPQQLYWYARAKDQEQLEKHHLFDCIECGACSWVCPSSIPLVQYYRAAKSHIVETRDDKQRAERSKGRFEARQERVEREAAERERKRAERKATAQQKAAASEADDPVQAAIARTKARKEQAAQTKDAS